ncbi:hypothetical protein QBC44DRAFT_241097 [Cladorrhinum sp. PSN332]|nr:hypothetical protein QBC44DRAFT_241097 [Cladorrhinum sp. PSN332]
MGQFSSTEVCTAPSCLHAASNILHNLAPHWKTMDPCTDFEKMVCWNYDEFHDAGSMGFNELPKQNIRILKKILNGNYADLTTHRSTLLEKRDNLDEYNLDMLQQAFGACMDTTSQANAGLKPVIDFVGGINKLWPFSVDDLQKKADGADFDALVKAAVYLEKFRIPVWNTGAGEPPMTVFPDLADPTKGLIYVGGVALSFPKTPADYLDKDKAAGLATQINATLSYVYPVKIDAAQGMKLAQGVVQFEAEVLPPSDCIFSFSHLVPCADRTQDEGVTKKSFAQLASLAPELKLDKFATGLLPAGHKSEQVAVSLENSWPEVNAIVKRQPAAILQAWLVWRTWSELFRLVVSPPELQEIFSITPPDDQEDACVVRVQQSLRFVLERFFVEQTYSEQGRAASIKMIEKLKTEFKKRLSTYSWMGKEAKQRAIKKVDNMIEEVGYSTSNPNIRDPQSLASYYTGLNITDDFFSNMMSSRQQRHSAELRKITEGIDRRTWAPDLGTYEVNAAYMPTQNTIFMFAGISRAPLFHSELPESVQYGALGAVIGHEITHGFDNSGSKFDENAKYQQWWDNATVAAFHDKSQCFVGQFNKFEYVDNGETKHGNGQQTLGENLSDAAGVAISYQAWQEERKSMPDVWDQGLPGLEDFTHEQLFFLAFGNYYCSKMNAHLYKVFETDPHAINAHRIRGIMANSRAFREAFKCQKKEPECELW